MIGLTRTPMSVSLARCSRKRIAVPALVVHATADAGVFASDPAGDIETLRDSYAPDVTR